VTTRVLECFDRDATSTAVVQGDVALTYAELADRVGRVAAGVAACSLREGDPVLVEISSGPDAVAAILGVVMSGHPYVYLDPVYPTAYHDRVIDVLTEEFGDSLLHLAGDGVRESKSKRVDFGEFMSDSGLSAALGEIADRIRPDALAYIVFTSGSTGMPKGVKVSHGNLDYSNAARSSVYAENPRRFLLLSSLAFDSSVAGLFWTLSTGGTLVLTERALGQSLDQLPELVEKYAITHTLCLPSVYAVLLRATQPEQLRTLTCVTVAGEGCPRDLVDLHQDIVPTASLYNEYGPSEATVWCAAARLNDFAGDEIVVGAPPPGTSLVVMNERRNVLADGIVGELVVAGPGVTQGYLANVDESAFFDHAGCRSYATGDLAEINAGVVTLKGRVDTQIKVNGVRLELTEIESRIEMLDAVADAAVPQPARRLRDVAPRRRRSAGY